MKRYLIILGLFLTLIASGQPIGIMASQGVAGGGAVYTDNFDSYTDEDDLGSQANWGTEDGSIKVEKPAADGKITGTDASYASCYYDDVFANNQYAKITVSVNNSEYIGVSVRNKGDGSGNYYGYYASAAYRTFYKIINGAYTSLGFITEASIAGTLELRVSGNVLSCYWNDILDSGLSNTVDGTFTDNEFSSGKAGVVAKGAVGSRLGDDWEGGDL